METAETHSMSMEFFAWPYMDKFFGENAGKYRYMHALDALSFIPYGTIVDAFQHIVYENPDMTPAERENPSILNSSRKRRIAAGAGVGVVDINRLLKQFEMMQTMARQLSGKKMKRFQRGGGKMPFGF